LRLRVAKPSVIVGAKAAADSLVLVPFPEDLWGKITDVEDGSTKDILDRAFWNAEGFSRSPTLPRFVGEFKRKTGNMNRNQLVMDMGTFQSQLQALSINTILWGGTYFDGKFEIFSSRRRGQKVRNIDLTDIVVLYYSTGGDQFSCDLDVDGSCRFPQVLFIHVHLST
jgi:hypothetical protein